MYLPKNIISERWSVAILQVRKSERKKNAFLNDALYANVIPQFINVIISGSIFLFSFTCRINDLLQYHFKVEKNF